MRKKLSVKYITFAGVLFHKQGLYLNILQKSTIMDNIDLKKTKKEQDCILMRKRNTILIKCILFIQKFIQAIWKSTDNLKSSHSSELAG